MPDEVLANIAADPAYSSAVTDIVTGSCAHDVRHGHATSTSVSIAQPDSHRTATIVIANDGKGSVPSSRPGPGTSLIDDVAIEWNLEETLERLPRPQPQPSGSRRHVEIPRMRPQGCARNHSAESEGIPCDGSV